MIPAFRRGVSHRASGFGRGGAVAAVLALATSAGAAPRAYIPAWGADPAARGSVTVVDLRTDGVVAVVPVGVRPGDAAASPLGTRVFVANAGSDSVSVIDTARNAVVDELPTGAGPVALAVNPTGTRVYVANALDGTVSVLQPGISRVAAVVPVGREPARVLVDRTGERVFVVDRAAGTVVVMDAIRDRLAVTIPVGALPSALAVAPDGSLYVASESADLVAVIAPDTYEVRTWPLPAKTAPTAIGVDARGRVWVVGARGRATLHRPSDGAPIRRLRVGAGVGGIAFLDGGLRAYVPSTSGDAVSVVDAASDAPQVVRRVALRRPTVTGGGFVANVGITYDVTSMADQAGTCPSASTCTLRQALTQTNARTGADCADVGDVIQLQDNTTYTLALADLPVLCKVTIQGTPGSTVIDANGPTRTGRAFAIGDGGTHTPVVGLTAMTIQRGKQGSGPSNAGGAILNDGATLTLTNVLVQDSFSDRGGGGIANLSGGTLMLVGSQVHGNGADTTNTGGGILNGGALTLDASTIDGNHAKGGAGIQNGTNSSDGTTIARDSTISGNVAGTTGNPGGTYGGGGILVQNSPCSVQLYNSTVTNNAGAGAGGIYNAGNAPVVTVTNSIVAGNTGSPNADYDPGKTFTTDGHSVTGTTPLLDTLQPDPSAPSQVPVHKPLAGSPALGTGSNCRPLDERGCTRPTTGACDAGAVEITSSSCTPTTTTTSPTTATTTVTTTTLAPTTTTAAPTTTTVAPTTTTTTTTVAPTTTTHASTSTTTTTLAATTTTSAATTTLVPTTTTTTAGAASTTTTQAASTTTTTKTTTTTISATTTTTRSTTTSTTVAAAPTTTTTTLVAAVCGNGIVEPGEACDLGLARNDAADTCCLHCQLRPSTYVCRGAPNVCLKDAICNTGGGECPANAAAPPDTPCQSDNPCTAKDHCADGACVPAGQKFCDATIISRKPTIKIACRGIAQQRGANCMAVGLVELSSTGVAAADRTVPTAAVAGRTKAVCTPNAAGKVEYCSTLARRLGWLGIYSKTILDCKRTPCGEALLRTQRMNQKKGKKPTAQVVPPASLDVEVTLNGVQTPSSFSTRVTIPAH